MPRDNEKSKPIPAVSTSAAWLNSGIRYSGGIAVVSPAKNVPDAPASTDLWYAGKSRRGNSPRAIAQVALRVNSRDVDETGVYSAMRLPRRLALLLVSTVLVLTAAASCPAAHLVRLTRWEEPATLITNHGPGVEYYKLIAYAEWPG